MRTRRSYFPPTYTIPLRSRKQATNVVEPEFRTIVEMADNRTMAQMLQAPIEGYEDTIVVPQINANNFELKQTLINLVQSNQFMGRQDPHNHLRFFNKVTSTFRHPEVPNTTIKLLLFPFSLEGEARIWLDKETPRSILTWEDLVSKFINQLFPPSKTTYLRNEITNFLQKPNETFNEAWERFKDLLSKSKVRYSRSRITDSSANTNGLLSSLPSNSFDLQQIAASLKDKLDIRMNRFEKSLNDMKNSFITPTAPIKAVEEDFQKKFEQKQDDFQNQMMNFIQNLYNNKPSSSSSLPSNTIPNPKGEAKAIMTRSGMTYKEPPIPPPGVEEQEPTEETTDTELPSTEDIQSPSSSLPSNTIPNPKGEAKAITTRSGMTYKEPPITPLGVEEQEPTEETTNTELPSTQDIQPPLADLGASINLIKVSIWKKLKLPTLNDTKMVLELIDKTISKSTGVVENVFVKVGKFYFPADFVVLDFIADPRVPLILGRPFLSTAHAIINVQREIIIRQDQQSLTIQRGDILSIKKVEQINKIDFINAWGIDFESEEIENFLNDDSIPLGVEDSSFNREEDILFLKSLLKEDPISSHPIIPNQTKLPIEEPKHLFKMGHEPFNNNLVTNGAAESSTKNLIPIPHECEVVSENRSKSIEPVNDNSLVFTTISNPLFDNDKINSDEINSHVESNSDESTSNHDTVKWDYLDEFYGPFIPIHILEEERIRREHGDYINLMEMLFTINPTLPFNPHPHPSTYANTNVESFSSLPIPIQDSNPRQEEIDVVAITNNVLPLSVKNDDSDKEVDAVGDLRVDNFIQNSEHEYFESEDSDFDIPLVPLPPPKPPDKEFNFEIAFEKEILVVRSAIVKLECIDARMKFDVFNVENDDLSYFMFVIFDKMFSLLSAESEDTIFDPGISE
nr:reverse transcriptase domain-containing protein [Tanacetum cinerariifolium]